MQGMLGVAKARYTIRALPGHICVNHGSSVLGLQCYSHQTGGPSTGKRLSRHYMEALSQQRKEIRLRHPDTGPYDTYID